MNPVKSYGAINKDSAIAPMQIERRDLGAHDVSIDILYCGVCHSDIHMARSEWGPSVYPIVPGHEIVGIVKAVGSAVTQFKVGQTAGVGVFVDSCRTCPSCQGGQEQYCDNNFTPTYNGFERDGKTPTFGGYSSNIVVDEKYTLHIPFTDHLDQVAPLLCAGITTYSPLKFAGVGKGHKVAVLGLGGLGHMGVKFAVAMGAEVTMLSTSPSKEADAKRLGAHHFVLSTDKEQMKKLSNHFDFILNTVAAHHDMNAFLHLLKLEGKMLIVGIPPEDHRIAAASLISKRRSIIGSNIGGIAETQEMLNYCAEHNILSDIELIPMNQINEAYERIIKSDVKYRFVIDMRTI
ncbi:NAD(P)-dependent alcohol dehydrogenase [Aquirufa aurantiipilula]|uniref:NAD(P)-dependent alcohol dehydrogenase n=1 Tax=Aquirufa aurantiipilula TaxID=2696561 RepID=UPI001CAA7ADD|nr:NAD(P)-dependent alcohol dehydrogenase [Aquirufa aurantiipilula]MBZ1327191.1 NAD(P)-dependent alcohol dehydrogenase [Aquirufa aurantiipilula]